MRTAKRKKLKQLNAKLRSDQAQPPPQTVQVEPLRPHQQQEREEGKVPKRNAQRRSLREKPKG